MMRQTILYILLPFALWLLCQKSFAQTRTQLEAKSRPALHNPGAPPANASTNSKIGGANPKGAAPAGARAPAPAARPSKPGAGPGHPVGEAQAKKPEEKKTEEKEGHNGEKHHHIAHPAPLLIPPPPPTLPGAGVFSTLPGAPVDFMSAADLKGRQKDIGAEIAEARKQLVDTESAADDKRKRSTLFASLYTEGVVSRKELEASQKEDSAAQDDLKAVKLRMESLEHEQSAVNSRLNKLAKSSSKGAGKHSEGKRGASPSAAQTSTRRASSLRWDPQRVDKRGAK